MIVNSKGEIIPATETIRTGSLLYIVEPQEIIWNEPEELYPFVFVAQGDWVETASVEPPEGFVSDYDALTVLVHDDSTQAVQFTLTDVGSDWVSTLTRHELLHNNRREVVLGEVAVALEQNFAMAKGLDQWGRALDPLGAPNPAPAIPNPSARLEGWIEAGPADVVWTFKVEMIRDAGVSLQLENLDGTVLTTLVSDVVLGPGKYSFFWDPVTMVEQVPVGGLQVRIRADQVDRVYRLRLPPRTPNSPTLPEVSADGVAQ
jgi:hypothetical protein